MPEGEEGSFGRKHTEAYNSSRVATGSNDSIVTTDTIARHSYEPRGDFRNLELRADVWGEAMQK